MFEELLRCRRTIGSSKFRGRKVRIKRDGLVEMLERVLREQFFKQLTPSLEFLLRFFGAGRDGNLSIFRSGTAAKTPTHRTQHEDRKPYASPKTHRDTS